jgi:hypothetical protein
MPPRKRGRKQELAAFAAQAPVFGRQTANPRVQSAMAACFQAKAFDQAADAALLKSHRNGTL